VIKLFSPNIKFRQGSSTSSSPAPVEKPYFPICMRLLRVVSVLIKQFYSLLVSVHFWACFIYIACILVSDRIPQLRTWRREGLLLGSWFQRLWSLDSWLYYFGPELGLGDVTKAAYLMVAGSSRLIVPVAAGLLPCPFYSTWVPGLCWRAHPHAKWTALPIHQSSLRIPSHVYPNVDLMNERSRCFLNSIKLTVEIKHQLFLNKIDRCIYVILYVYVCI
jgi:hypothetical protein